jgi:hypothetical protein
MTSKDALKLERLVENYKERAVAESRAGDGDPADAPYLRAALDSAKNELYSWIEYLSRRDCR